MGTPVALKGHQHICPMFSGNTPHVGGPINQGESALTVNGIPVALTGHKCDCQVGGPDTLVQGHPSLTVNGIAVVLQGASTAHGGKVIQGDAALTVS
ncbi:MULTISPECIES: PAAR domain-containing protein [Shewanella]|jgi:uncharacterized Zn-binding protein involved in type VI secretion|uniref:Uncharacterized conserved protein n=8 Tax=Bacteria TaxID=2 RepID=A0A2T3GWN7_9GAMM|nr:MULTISPECIES: PAAR domain-containing protein [Shewanella]AXQ15459.1 hypothetical protein BS332_15450 [Shewanella algae]AYV13336.1 hypothetical protein EEY24_10805 [Shewanella algae]EKT4485651.1 PAAR domain-containing protein [Shewanella algae]MBC8797578.1 PAAR domain-containing protein [Shewanella algae]MBO2547379.1 PAAR domain-containing protein [Shewanella algae]